MIRIFCLIIMICAGGCADLDLRPRNFKDECGGRYSEKVGTPGYPCRCCRPGSR
jgi:hypothetical protein